MIATTITRPFVLLLIFLLQVQVFAAMIDVHVHFDGTDEHGSHALDALFHVDEHGHDNKQGTDSHCCHANVSFPLFISSFVSPFSFLKSASLTEWRSLPYVSPLLARFLRPPIFF